jgi:prephenate dehydrogenase
MSAVTARSRARPRRAVAVEGPVAILGLGLIGGSLARELSAGGVEVWGYDADAAATREAHRAGVITRRIGRGFRALREARVVILAVPVDAAPALLARAAPHLGEVALVTDVGSTKRSIQRAAATHGLAPVFVGSHPMAGDHRAGWHAARPGLFARARVHLCRSPVTTPGAWKRARALWRAVGAVPVEQDATRHDAEMAFVSHLPQLLSLALAGTLSSRAIARDRLGTGGRDMTRMAASSMAMWTAILEDNTVPVLDALETCIGQLGALRGAVARGDRSAIEEAFRVGNAWSLDD